MTKPVAKRAPTRAKKPAGARRVSKTEFVLSLPEALPAADVVARALQAGLVMREKYVYNVRATHRARAGGSPARGRRSIAALEAQFIELALDIGFARAEELFAEIRAKLRSPEKSRR